MFQQDNAATQTASDNQELVWEQVHKAQVLALVRVQILTL